MASFQLPKKEDPIPPEREYAEDLDGKDPLRHLRAEFVIPTKADLKSKTLSKSSIQLFFFLIYSANILRYLKVQAGKHSNEPCIYLCGNSLGLQPRRTSERVASHLAAWATKGVLGHFTEHEDSNLPPFLHVDDAAAECMAPVVGALPSEVAVMETLTANLHFLMASFYKPTKTRYKIILEGKAFPSDHYAITSQILHHSLVPADALILIQPTPPAVTLTTFQILSTISQHANTTALILLPGIQYYTGQLLNIPAITTHAHSYSIPIGWDLAHAVGNVPLHLHDWNVDFAAWCNYKYMNSGPGAIGALFVHSEHGNVDMTAHLRNDQYKPRLSGWWGGQKSTRFTMGSDFIPSPGAKGWQVGNPSALALTALLASLEVFEMTSVTALREKSIALTSYLESLLLQSTPDTEHPYEIITPSERGAQLSIRLQSEHLDSVLKSLEEQGVVVDERKPDVVRVAPAPLYNTFVEVWEFVKIFKEACARAAEGQGGGGSVMVEGGKGEKGWGMVK